MAPGEELLVLGEVDGWLQVGSHVVLQCAPAATAGALEDALGASAASHSQPGCLCRSSGPETHPQEASYRLHTSQGDVPAAVH